MKTSLILLACLLAIAVAQRGGGGPRGGGRGGGRGRGPPPGAKCADGSRPTCSDGSEPKRRRGAPPCDDDLPPLTCTDGSTPVDRDGDPICPREERRCCDGTELNQGRRPRPRCEDGQKPVCSDDQCTE